MIDCLTLASLTATGDYWQNFYDQLSERYSEKAVIVKMENLDGKGYLDSGVSSRTGWLTEKGCEVLGAAVPRYGWKADA